MAVFSSWEKIKDPTKYPTLFQVQLGEMIKMWSECAKTARHFLIIFIPSFSVLSVDKFMTFELLELKCCHFSVWGPALFKKCLNSWKHGVVQLCRLGIRQEVKGVLNDFFITRLLPSRCGKFLFPMAADLLSHVLSLCDRFQDLYQGKFVRLHLIHKVRTAPSLKSCGLRCVLHKHVSYGEYVFILDAR